MNKKKREILEHQDWPRIIKELTLHAHSRFTFWNLLKQKGIKGFSPEEIAYQAIEMVLTGEWNWNPNKSELLPYLKFCVVNGLVANLAKNKEVKVANTADIQELNVGNSSNLENDLNAKQVLVFIRNELKDDKLLIEILNCLYDGLKRADIHEMLNIDLETYDNALRRLKFRLLKLKKAGLMKSLIN
ncbi:hypothetical protein QQ008_21275 [Fulvivirgaceae bacterium BMA10]|uniref:Sigma-70 family RNA polymerase sigma factor n=1 Tax=Splendidivirga corallicola TaxID=3051826 RepID=A0ABT8KU92_9BACT|nr:hypothetical protein [Fulvivirgaceae bacterium BMA10]